MKKYLNGIVGFLHFAKGNKSKVFSISLAFSIIWNMAFNTDLDGKELGEALYILIEQKDIISNAIGLAYGLLMKLVGELANE